MKKHTFFFRYLLIFVSVYAFLYGSYLLLSVGLPAKTIFLQSRRYLPCALAVSLSLYFWCKAGYPLTKLLPYSLVSLFWSVTYPLCYWLTYHKNTTFIDNPFDQSFAAYLFTALVCLRLLSSLVSSKGGWGTASAYLFGLLHTLLILVPLTQFLYYLNYQSPITEAACMAFLQTNPAEAREYLLQNLGILGLTGAGLALVILFFLFSRLHKLELRPLPFSRRLLVAIILICGVTGFYSGKIFRETGVLWAYHNAQDYFQNSQLFNKYHQANFAALEVQPARPLFKKPGTMIMVIGESASRMFLSAYGYQGNDTTPWMKSMLSDPGALLFKHAYTSWGQTVPALERALTEKNQYNTKEFNQSISLIDIARKAGYTTYWFSNQGTISNADTPITLVAKTADHTKWIEEDLANTSQMKYDGDLVPYLQKVDPSQNNFIILHIMGSHDSAINRYPASFTKFGQPGVYDLAVNYDNSIAYTDYVLQQIYEYSKAHLNLEAMVYFSDHGADPLVKRNADRSNFISLRIPLFMYLSEDYRQVYPQTAATLRSHADSYFTNDLLYETMCGIMGITSNHYDEANSLTSPKYKYTRETLTTELGKKKLTEDKEEK